MNELITINVSGKIHQVKRKTLLKIPYFANMITDCGAQSTESIFLERSSKVFDDVIAYVIDPLHPFPLKYRYELDFLGIEYNVDKLYDDNKQRDQQYEILKTYMTSIQCFCCCKCKKQFIGFNGLLCFDCYNNQKCIIVGCNNIACSDRNFCKTHINESSHLCQMRGCPYHKNDDEKFCLICALNLKKYGRNISHF